MYFVLNSNIIQFNRTNYSIKKSFETSIPLQTMNAQDLDSILFPPNTTDLDHYSPTESHEDLSNILQKIPFPNDPSDNLTKTFTPFKDNIITSSLTPTSIMKWNYSNIKQNANELFPTVVEPTMMDEPLDKSPEAPSRHKSHFDSHPRSSKRQEYQQEFSSQGKLKSLKEQLVAIENELNYERERGKHIEREFERKMVEIRKQHEQDEERWEYEIRKMRDSREKEMTKLQEIINHQKRILDDEKVSIKNSKNAYLTPLLRLMASLGILTSNDMDFEENLRRIFEYIKELREKIQVSDESKKKQIALSSELDITKMENSQLKETLKNNQVKNAENVEKIATMHNELLAKKNELASLELQLKEIKGNFEKNNSNESLSIQAKIKELNENLKTLENKNKILEDRNETLEKEKESSNQGGELAMKNLKNEIRELEFELKKERERSQKLKDSETENEKRLEELHDKLSAKEKDIKELKDLIRKKESQNLQISDEIILKNKDINELKSTTKQLEQTIETLKRENKDLGKNLDSLKQKLMDKEKEMTEDLDETSEPKPDINKLKEQNKRLTQEVNELLRFKLEKENNINISNSPGEKKVTHGEIEKLLSDFSQKETEFENIKQSFINKLYNANEKLAFSEQKYNKLLEENTQLRGQIEALDHQKSPEIGEFEMRSTVHSTSDEVASPDYANNILDMISPEMLSSDETIFLVLEMLRRISQSHKLAITLMKSKEFKELTKRICHHYAQSKQMSADSTPYKSEPASSRNLR